MTRRPDAPILCLNSGSSSLKFALFRIDTGTEERIDSGEIDAAGPAQSIQAVFARLTVRPQAVGHRLVHGGPRHFQPEIIDDALLRELREVVEFAPLHLPSQLRLIEAVRKHDPGLPQVACFDTAFHARMPEAARRLPLPREFYERGIRHYGFHGLSYEFIMSVLGEEGKGRVIIAHLGNGASMAAVRNGEPLDTSMGMTPTGGLIMGTRSGDLDPGVLLHLLRSGQGAEQLEQLLNHQSGLLGISGTSSDMKELLEKRASDGHAAQAVEMFCYAARKFIGAYAAVLGGVDTLVFTAGIGEHAAPVREEICRGLEFLGIELDSQQNQKHAPVISSASSRCTVRVIPTDEDLVIARHTLRIVISDL